jgi:Skp family chaperone for outer membrane proteins
MQKLLLPILVLLLAAGVVRADVKIALVDTSQVFDAFYKTKVMATRIATEKQRFENEIRDVALEYQTTQQEAAKLSQEVKNTATPVDERKSKDAALGQKVQDLKALEHEIDAMRKSRSDEIKAELIRGHQEIADEITQAISTYAATQGYDLVLDKSYELMPTFPFKSWKINDLTADIISRLNATAPAPGGMAPPPPPKAKPVQ